MWVMGYNDGADFNMPDSVNGRKLRPLIPRPTSATSTHNSATTPPPPCLGLIHGSDLFAINHHLATVGEQGTRQEFNTPSVVVSSRWNPTPEQLRTLEDLYRRGTRTPSADQIQHITAQLRRYGKIEGKNVFYWFQNHKARERQKRRRQLESVSDEQHRDIETFERKESGGSRTGFEVEENKNWAPPTNCSTLAEESVLIQRAAKAAVAECRTDGWTQFDEGELQHRRSLVERNATWQMMQLSCPPPTHLINITPPPPFTTTTSTTTATTTAAIRTMDPKLIKTTQDLNFFIAPYRENLDHLPTVGSDEEAFGESHQTLQLFPLRSESCTGEKEIAAMNANFTTPYQYFEFLPLKN